MSSCQPCPSPSNRSWKAKLILLKSLIGVTALLSSSGKATIRPLIDHTSPVMDVALTKYTNAPPHPNVIPCRNIKPPILPKLKLHKMRLALIMHIPSKTV